jgi:polyphosphate kinase
MYAPESDSVPEGRSLDLERSPQIVQDLDDPSLYANRELSLLEFQGRVLEEAEDERNPLLERLRFLAIVGSNLDEFFMVRVAGLKQQIAAGVRDASPDGLTPAEQLDAALRVVAELMRRAKSCFHDKLLPALRQAGIVVLDHSELDPHQREAVKSYFDRVVFPVLTPLAVDPGRPFPHISNLSLNLAVWIRQPSGEERFARIKVPGTLPRLVPVERPGPPSRVVTFVWLEQVVAANLDALFPAMEVLGAHCFRVIRDADVVIQDLEADDLLETIEESVRRRRFGTVVRLSVDASMPESIRQILTENLEIQGGDLSIEQAPLGLSGLMRLYDVDRHDLKEPAFLPAIPAALDVGDSDADLFAAIRREDILLHHPFDSFAPVVQFLQAAARDPDVLAIKMTLYRVGRNSPVVEALLEASENRKQVAVLVELKARFDEESNIGWARALEREGVHVVYGLLGVKTHAKVALVVRREGERIRRYVHLATGNYNPATAQGYTDLGLFTADEEIGADATDLFNYLTGYSGKRDYRKLLVAPIHLRQRLEALIEREIAHQSEGRRGHIVLKMNGLADKPITRLLYRASQAGVRVDLLVRGICCLRPGISGVSENIRVTSIVGRFLEHSRVFYFRNGGAEEVFLGSADLLPRNLGHRVEVLFPVRDRGLVRQLHDEVLETYLADNVKARLMLRDGSYVALQPVFEQPLVNSQASLLRRRTEPPRR